MRRSRDRKSDLHSPRFGRVQACGVDLVFDRGTVLRYPITPGKSSRRPAPRPAAPACGPPRTFSRGDGVSENRPAVEDDIHAACLYSADASNLGRKRCRISRVRVQLAIGPSPSIRRANEWKLFVFPRSIHGANFVFTRQIGGQGHRNSVWRWVLDIDLVPRCNAFVL